MREAVLCPQCEKSVPPDAPQGLCPACMMQLGLNSAAAEKRPLPPSTAREQGAATLPPPTEAFDADSVPSSAIGAAIERAPTPTIPGYVILSELGRGGMGVVYKAKHVKLGRLVALKMILAGSHAGEAEITRFRTEAEAIARLKHENIIQIYEIGEHEGKPYWRPSPNQVVQTPNIDRLAREGVLFRNAFVNAPSCTPSRSAVLSGRYFFKTGRGAILQGAV